MTFLIEPGLALKQSSAQPDRAESKSSAGGSGDAFARSLQEDRRTERDADAASAPIGKTSDTEQARSPLSLLRDSQSDAVVDNESTPEIGEPVPPGEGATDEAALSDAEARIAQEGDIDPDTADFSEQDEDEAAESLAGVLAAPEETAQSPTDSEASKDMTVGIAPGANPEAHAETRADAQPKETPPAPEAQAMTVQAMGEGEARQGASRTSDKEALAKSTIEVRNSSAAKPDTAGTAVQHSAGAPEGKKNTVPDNGTKLPEEDGTFPAELSDAAPEASSNTGKTGTVGQTSPTPDGNTQLAASALGASSVSQPAPQSVQSPVQMTPANAVVTASPAETVKIITDAVSSPDDTPDRITVQLDPPELGRVSIDFKFDAHGIQHITITGESPEATRQLRLMHFELTQALERGGLSSQNMTFQQQQSGHQQSHTPASGRLFENNGPSTDPALLTSATLTADSIRPARTASGGLDIRL